MNLQCHRIYFLFFFLLAACSECQEKNKKIYPISINLLNQWVEPLDSIRDSINYLWNTKASFINNSKDTIWISRGSLSKNINCDVIFYILNAQKVYNGSHIKHSDVTEFIKIYPNDTIFSKVYFLLPKDFLPVNELYIKIIPEFSLSLPPYDTIAYHTPAKLLKRILYRPQYMFNIKTTTSNFNNVDYDIDSLIREKKYEVIKVHFW